METEIQEVEVLTQDVQDTPIQTNSVEKINETIEKLREMNAENAMVHEKAGGLHLMRLKAVARHFNLPTSRNKSDLVFALKAKINKLDSCPSVEDKNEGLLRSNRDSYVRLLNNMKTHTDSLLLSEALTSNDSESSSSMKKVLKSLVVLAEFFLAPKTHADRDAEQCAGEEPLSASDMLKLSLKRKVESEKRQIDFVYLESLEDTIEKLTKNGHGPDSRRLKRAKQEMERADAAFNEVQ
jgi:flagellar biosynthesis/type III secretory pathway chaperone